mgnify:CR=1 FL=1
MTLVNIHLEQRRALVACDTAVANSRGQRIAGSASKLWVIPSGGLVVTGRGGLLLTACVATYLAGGAEPLDGLSFDTAPRFLPEAVKNGWLAERTAYPASAAYAGDALHTLYLCGWSDKRQSMAAACVELRNGTIEGMKLAGAIIAPSFQAEPDAAPQMATDAEMMDGARRQVFSRSSDEGIGGSLHVAELTMIEGRFCAAVRDLGPIE